MSVKRIFLGPASDGAPRHMPADELAARLFGFGWIAPLKLKEEYQIPDELWPTVQKELARPYRELIRKGSSGGDVYQKVNQRLRRYALIFHPYGRADELAKADAILQGESPSEGELLSLLHDIVMGPGTRARLLTGMYMKVPLCAEFAYVIDASYFAYARGNYVAAFLAIVPIVEGLLLRWRGHRSATLASPPIAEAAKWVRETPKRNPLLATPLLADSWAESCSYILEHHFYKNTQLGSGHNNFNRHLTLHMLEDRRFCSPDNLMRAFLLLDVLTWLYLCEQGEGDPIMFLKTEEEEPHIRAYRQAMMEQITGAGTRPEELLWTHPRIDLRNTVKR